MSKRTLVGLLLLSALALAAFLVNRAFDHELDQTEGQLKALKTWLTPPRPLPGEDNKNQAKARLEDELRRQQELLEAEEQSLAFEKSLRQDGTQASPVSEDLKQANAFINELETKLGRLQSERSRAQAPPPGNDSLREEQSALGDVENSLQSALQTEQQLDQRRQDLHPRGGYWPIPPSEWDNLTARYNEAQAQVADLTQHRDQLALDIKRQAQETASQRAETSNGLETQIADLEDQIAAAKEDRRKMEEQVASFNQDKKADEGKITALEEQIQASRTVIRSLKLQIDPTRTDLDRAPSTQKKSQGDR